MHLHSPPEEKVHQDAPYFAGVANVVTIGMNYEVLEGKEATLENAFTKVVHADVQGEGPPAKRSLSPSRQPQTIPHHFAIGRQVGVRRLHAVGSVSQGHRLGQKGGAGQASEPQRYTGNMRNVVPKQFWSCPKVVSAVGLSATCRIIAEKTPQDSRRKA